MQVDQHGLKVGCDCLATPQADRDQIEPMAPVSVLTPALGGTAAVETISGGDQAHQTRRRLSGGGAGRPHEVASIPIAVVDL